MQNTFILQELPTILINIWHEVCFCVTIKVPNKNAVRISSTEDLFAVEWIEECIHDWFGVADVALEPIWYGFLRLVVPNF